MKINNKNRLLSLLTYSLLLFSIILSYGDNPKTNTVITSNRVEMDSNDKFNIFKFYENVHLEGDDLDAVCDELEVISKKTNASSTLNDVNSLEKITAIGHVHIKQTNRTIDAGHAVLYPGEGKAVLTQNPKVISDQGIIQGHIITYYKNNGKAYVEGGPNGERPKITLSNLPDLNKTHQVNETPHASKDSTSQNKPENNQKQTLPILKKSPILQ